MSTILALSRPSGENFPLLVHVLGAMVLVGGLLTGASALAFARGDTRLVRLGYWTLLAVGLPGLVIMRLGAEWIYRKSIWDDVPDEPTWIMIGGITADIGGAIFVLSLVAGYIGVHRMNDGGGGGLLRATMWISVALLAVYVVAAWAMAGKPD